MNNLTLYFLLGVFLFSCKQVNAQQDKLPESLISILSKKEIPASLDSLENRKFDLYVEKLTSAKSSSEMVRLMEGCWVWTKSVRINQQDTKIRMDLDTISFYGNDRFRIFESGRKVDGVFLFRQGEMNNLVLNYDSLQAPPLPAEMLARMSDEEIRANSYDQAVMGLFEVEEDILVFYFLMPLLNPGNPANLTHSRLFLNYYLRAEDCQ